MTRQFPELISEQQNKKLTDVRNYDSFQGRRDIWHNILAIKNTTLRIMTFRKVPLAVVL